MALVRWLQETPRVSCLGYYFLEDSPRLCGISSYDITASGTYYQLELDDFAVTKQIGKYAGSVAKKNAVSGTDPKTDQNALHYILSNDDLCPSENMRDTVLRASASLCTQDRENYYYGKLEQYRSLEEKLKSSKAHYTEVKKSIFTTDKLILNNRHLIISALIKPFEDDNESLMNQLLLVHDRVHGNTPLFYAYAANDSDDLSILELLKRINHLSASQKLELLVEPNENGQTVMHALVMNWCNLEDEKSVFGADLLKQALCYYDDNGNTPLHTVLDVSMPLTMTHDICQLFSDDVIPPPEAEYKGVPSDAILGKNNQGHNPFHLLCQRDSSKADDNLKILDELLKIVSVKSLRKKLLEQDNNGCTPLHLAIRAGNDALVIKILGIPNLQQPKQILETKDKQGRTLLHDACRYSKRETLNKVIEMLGQKTFHEIRSQSNLFKLVHKNNKLSEFDFQTEINKHNKLFDCYDYFVKIYSKTSEKYKNRMDDFCECLAVMERAFKANQHFYLPQALFNFCNTKGHMGGLFKNRNRYHKLRLGLQEVRQDELIEFQAFLNERANDKVAKLLIEKMHLLPPIDPSEAPPPAYEDNNVLMSPRKK